MKRKAEDTTSVTGYILDVSTLKTSSSGVKYFDGFVQTTKDEVNRFVSFSPEKLDNFTTAHTMKSPVMINNAKITPKMGKKEIVIPRYSSLEVCPRRLDFSINKKGLDQSSTDSTTDSIKTASMTCTLTAKIVQLDETKNIVTKYGPRPLQNAVIADKTGDIKLPLWGTKADSLEEGVTYRLTNLCSQRYDNILQMTTTSTTVITKAEDIEVDYTYKTAKITVITGSVVVSNTSTAFKCLLCFKPLDVSDTDLDQKVACKDCFARQKLKNALKTKFVKLMIKDEKSEIHKINISSNVISDFLKKKNMENLSDEEIDDYFLDLENIKVKHNPESDMATEIQCE